jgi:hypothetical protein
MEMGILSYLRGKFGKKSAQPALTYVEAGDEKLAAREAISNEDRELLSEIDFAHPGDLESYVRGLRVPKETIERWISTGLLFPREMKVAEKMIQIMRKLENDAHR